MHAAEARPSRLRVAMVLEGLAFGGCPVSAVDLAKVLNGRGHEVRLVAVDEDVRVSVLPYARQAGMPVRLVPRDAGLLRRARHLRAFMDEHDLAVLHAWAPWLGRPAAVAAGLGRRRAAVVLNWNMHTEYPTTFRTPLVVGTAEMRDEAARRLRGNAWLLEPAVDLDRDRPDPEAAARFRAAHGLSRDDLLVTLVGRVDRVMKLPGILRALAAVERLDDPRVRLVLVGDGDAMEQVRARAAEVDAALGRPTVVLTGSLDDPHPAYAAADVGLAMGGSAMRVLAHETPLVVLGEGVYSRVFDPASAAYFEGAGFYGRADPAGPDPLADQLAGLLASPGRAGLGAFGRAEVGRRLGMEAAADTLERVYRHALDTRSTPAVHAVDLGYLVARDALGRARKTLARRHTAPQSPGADERPGPRPAQAPAQTPDPSFDQPTGGSTSRRPSCATAQ